MATASAALPEPVPLLVTVLAAGRLLSLPAGWNSYGAPRLYRAKLGLTSA